MAEMRVHRALAQAGVASRRAAETLVADGRVTVNGQVATVGQLVRETDAIEVDGRRVRAEPIRTYMLNKGMGVVSTASDPEGRPTVLDTLPHDVRLYPIGRLDIDTTGLLLITNDGDLAHRLMHPSHGVEKEYLVEVEGRIHEGGLRRLRDGVELDDGPTAPAKASQPEPGILRITIHEGRNRQVRRMFEAIGHDVERLVRTRIGPLVDSKLRPGAWRDLSLAERKALIEAMAPETRR